MGIVLMSAPMLISTASSTTTVALQQEGINEASSRISMILTYPWDQNDINDSCISPVLHVSSGDIKLAENATSGRRVGVPLLTNSRTFKCGDIELNATTIGLEGTSANDIDDFSNVTLADLNTSGSGGVDYIEQDTVSIATAITYISDTADYNSSTVTFAPGAASGGTSNIKKIQVTLTSTSSTSEFEKNIILNAFSCNIGGFEYESRQF
jgi:hypothetical protein